MVLEQKKRKETPAEPPLSPLGPVSSPAQQAHARLILLPSLRLWLTPGPRPTHPLTPGAHMAAPSPSSRVTEKDSLLPRPTQSRNPRDIPCLMRQPSAIKRPPQPCSFPFVSPRDLATLATVFFKVAISPRARSSPTLSAPSQAEQRPQTCSR